MMHLVSDDGREQEKLSTKQYEALAALMAAGTIADAAREAGVSERTMYRWLSEDQAFIEAYRLRRRYLVDAVVGMMQASMSKAVKTLNAAMDRGPNPNAVRAALGLLEHGLKGIELDQVTLREFESVVSRLEALEAAYEQERGERWGA